MPRVLVLALENWLGAARLPKALRSAGFEVSVLCYPNTLISLTKYIDDRDICLPSDSAEIVVQRIMGLLEGHKTRMIIPADDRALRFMQHIVEVTPTGRLPMILTDLVRASLPDPDSFPYGQNKEAATELMIGFGVRTPARSLIWNRKELRDFVSEIGLPVVLKPLSGTAGQGVQILRTADDVENATIEGAQWMAQQYIVGKSAGSASVALDGKCLATIVFEKTLTYPGEMGPASVVTRVDSEEVKRAAAAFAKATNYNGFYSPGFMIEESTGLPYFLEVNTRCVPVIPSAAKLGVDLCRALYARMVGAPIPEPDESAPRMMALYPQELHRDPNSPYREHILDEPTDDPLLHRAMEKGIAMLAAERGLTNVGATH